MSFIDKALEKAKTIKPKPDEAGPAPAPKGPPPAPPEGQPLPPRQDIQYRVTQVVSTDPDLLRRQRILTPENYPRIKDEFDILRTHILQRTKAQQRNTLMIVSPLPNEGKTLTTINLAISLAQEVDKTVLLVDADLRAPSVHQYLGLPGRPGLVDYLTHGAAIPQLLVHPAEIPKLVVLPAGQAMERPAELLSSPMMTELVRELKNYYPDRYVLFDISPLLPYADALALAPLMDGLILLAATGATRREDILSSLELLKNYPVLGCILNKVEKSQPDYYYYYYSEKSNEAADTVSWWRRWLRR